MKIENFENLLARLEIEYEKKEVIKNNGLKKIGYMLKLDEEGHVKPTVYEEMIHSIDEITMVRKIEEMKTKICNKTCDIDDLLKNSGWFENRIRVAVRNRDLNLVDEERVRTICEKPFDDLEEYYYLKLTSEDMKKIGADTDLSTASMWVTTKMLKNYNYSKDWVRAKARFNSKKDIIIKPMSAVLNELMCVPFDEEVPEFNLVDDVMWVLSNEDKTLGAVGLIFEDILKDFATEHNIKTLAVLPSSIHEVLLVKINSLDEKENLEKMVKEVNDTQVAENEILSNKAYIIVNE